MAGTKSEKKILLTGVTGQVGSELFQCLQHLGTVIPTVAKGESFPAKCVEMDLADADSIQRVFAEVKPDLVVNPAAYTAVDRAEQDEDKAFKVNARAPALLAELTKKSRAALVHFSTDYVYPGSGTHAHRELDPVGPLNAYGRTKLAGDEAIAATGGNYLILRTSWVYGIIGHNFVHTMLRLASERETLSIINDQIGAPTSARTLADVTSMILSATVDQSGFSRLAERKGIYHCVNAGHTSWYDFAQEIFRLARQQGLNLKAKEITPIPTESYTTPARRPKNSRLSLDKLSLTFQITPSRWDSALAWAMPFIIAQGQLNRS